MRDNLRKVLGIIVLLMLALGAVSAFFQRHRAGTIQQAVADTRHDLRAQGFKTDLSDFHLHTDAAVRTRETALTFFGAITQPASPADEIELLPTAPDGSVIVIWKQDWLKSPDNDVTWTDVRNSLEEIHPELDAACDAALGGPIQFDLDANRGRAMLLPHLAALRKLSQALGARTLSDLHENHPDAAFTNLLALTRICAAWNVEPAEVSHLVRERLVRTAFEVTWQALQSNNWQDDRLATLQQEWEAADFFTNLPEVSAFLRASDAEMCRQERNQPVTEVPLSEIVKQSIQTPRSAIPLVRQSWDTARYRSYGTYEDEKNIMLFYKQREIEVRQAIDAPTWDQLRKMPAATNQMIFESPYRSRMGLLLRTRTISTRMMGPNSSLLSRAAVCETERRIIVTAIALERFHGKHGAYPRTLAELAPVFLKASPMDFMDGQSLRYRRADDAHFKLYSVGLDCVDDGGITPPPENPSTRSRRLAMSLGGPSGNQGSIVWPQQASAQAINSERQMEQNAAMATADDEQEREATFSWQHTDKRQAGVERLLATPAITNVADVTFQGHLLGETLHNQAADTNQASLLDMFTLKQVVTGDEPETITFELPVAYDTATNLGELCLMVDPDYTTGDEEGSGARDAEVNRSTSGNSLIAWHTIYESPGKHVLQAAFIVNDSQQDKPELCGPLLPFVVSNLCQFTTTSAHFEPSLGATWRGRFPEDNAKYVIELTDTNGARLKTISGSTSNGQFKATWDLVDDNGQRFAGDEFNSVFHLTLPGSARTQALRGP